MSKIKFSEGVFLGTKELQRMFDFLQAEGYKKHLLQDSLSFGLIKDATDSSFVNGSVVAGSDPQTVKISETYALDKNGNLIYLKETDNVAIPNDGNQHWIRIQHQLSPLEEGTVSIDINGNLTGVGTKFTEVLRGKPDFPSVIKFIGAASNIIEYEVVEVINDTTALLAGMFAAEATLEYKVIGTFEPAKVPSAGNKDIFQYDSAIVDVIEDSALTVLVDEQFLLARVEIVAGVPVIHDYRTSIWKTSGRFWTEFLDRTANPLIGMESIKYDNAFTTQVSNIASVAWGFRSDNWSINTNQNQVTLSSGQGGKFKSTSDFTNGDFDGWRIYAGNSGEYARVKTSVLSGSDINLVLDTLNPPLFDIGGGVFDILVVPDVDEVEVTFYNNDKANVTHTEMFKVNTPIAEMKIVVPGTTYLYGVRYRYNRLNEYNGWNLLPSDTVGFYDESSFDSEGVLETDPQDRNRVIYSSDPLTSDEGYILFTQNPSAYSAFSERVDTGQKLGVFRRELDNANPLLDITVSVDEEHQLLQNQQIVLSVDHYIDLKKPVGIKDGNWFEMEFKTRPTLNGFSIHVVEDYVNAGNPGTELWKFTDQEVLYNTSRNGLVGENGIVVKFVYDAETDNWKVFNRTNTAFKNFGVRSSNTNADNSNPWSKVATMRIDQRYQTAKASFDIMSVGKSNGTGRKANVQVTVKQQAALASPPAITVAISEEVVFSRAEVWAILRTNDANITEVELWLRHIGTYENFFVTVRTHTHTKYGGINAADGYYLQQHQEFPFDPNPSGISTISGDYTQNPTGTIVLLSEVYYNLRFNSAAASFGVGVGHWYGWHLCLGVNNSGGSVDTTNNATLSAPSDLANGRIPAGGSVLTGPGAIGAAGPQINIGGGGASFNTRYMAYVERL